MQLWEEREKKEEKEEMQGRMNKKIEQKVGRESLKKLFIKKKGKYVTRLWEGG